MNAQFFRNTRLIIRRAGGDFINHDPITLAGALAFFTIFASPPILIMIIFIVGQITGQDMASREVFAIITQSVGQEGADLVQNIVNNYFVEGVSLFQRIVSGVIFVFASSTYFIIIQRSLNQVWGVKSKAESFGRVMKDRGISFVLIFLLGVTLLLTLVLDSAFAYLGDNLDPLLPTITPILINSLGYVASFFAVMLALAMIYKFLPDVIIEWKVVWVGAAVTSFLFLVGRFLITYALTSSNIYEMYGAAGSTAIFLLWVFYSFMIFFFGAEITQQYACEFAETIQPKDHAVKVVQREEKKENVSDESCD